MYRLAKLLPALLFFAFVLFFPAEMRADPLVITNGSVFIGGAPNSRNAWRAVRFNFSVGNLQLNAGAGDGDSTHHPRLSCGPCQPGSPVSSDSVVISEGVGTAVVDGTQYTAWLNNQATTMTFTGETVLFPGDTNNASTITLTTSFSMTGSLVVYDAGGSHGVPIFSSLVMGQGTAFLDFTRLGDNWWLRSVEYKFAQTPEPATLMLLGTGLAGMAAYRRRRKAKGAS